MDIVKQQDISNIIKEVHQNLKESTQLIGASKAWQNHLSNTEILKNYAEAMKLLSDIWDKNVESETNIRAKSRITWIINYCMSYYYTHKIYLTKRYKEERILNYQIDYNNQNDDIFNYLHLNENDNLNILDVGSCFNPLKNVKNFNVIAFDLYPCDKTVYKGDFLNIQIDKTLKVNNLNEIQILPENYFHCVIFSLLLEYLPLSEQRIDCCKKAYNVLKYEGILIIITPDSNNVGKNAKLMKNWRYTLGLIGFSRVKFEKLSHITCLVFRKSLNKSISEKWSNLHKENYMTYSIHTPQDK